MALMQLGRQMPTGEPLLPEPSSFQVETNWKAEKI